MTMTISVSPPNPELPKPDNGGLRYNTGKNKIELLPPEWTWALGMVTTRGSIKYEENNWIRGMKWTTMIGCAGRHLLKFVCGERYDPETGCHHLAMVAWNALALMTYDLRQLGTDDRIGDRAVLDACSTEMGPELQKIANQKG